MQTIGKTNDGRMLVVLRDQDVQILRLIERVMGPELEIVPLPDPPAAETAGPAGSEIRLPRRSLSAKRGPKRRSAAVTKPDRCKTIRNKNCVICENAFTDDSKTNCRKICKKLSCKVELKKRYQANYRKTGKTTARSAAATRMPAANPADPNLTDEQRRNILAAREKMIAAAAQRHREEI